MRTVLAYLEYIISRVPNNSTLEIYMLLGTKNANDLLIDMRNFWQAMCYPLIGFSVNTSAWFAYKKKDGT